jgi:hypothetical protein
MDDLERVLMIVKTYPNASTKYGELTCTAGIRLRDNAWVRIYPYPFRIAEKDQQFKKYQVIHVPLEKSTQDDPRPDSFKVPDGRLKNIELGEIIATDQNWSKRMPFIRATALSSVQAFEDQMVTEVQGDTKPPVENLFGDIEAESIKKEIRWGATIRPIPVNSDFSRVEARFEGDDWPENTRTKLEQVSKSAESGLFTEDVKRPIDILRFPHYKFYLTFRDLTGTEYTKLILDWEIYRLYFRILDDSGSREEAVEKVKFKIEQQIFGLEREVFLILGNMHHRFQKPMLAVDGFVYPKRMTKAAQSSLFDLTDV